MTRYYLLAGAGYALGMTLSSAGELAAALVVLGATLPAAMALFWAQDRRGAEENFRGTKRRPQPSPLPTPRQS
jgi:hypothetical protein